MYNFTGSPLERLMKEKPRPVRIIVCKPPHGSPCCGCACWQGMVCVGSCVRAMNLLRKVEGGTSGQHKPSRFGSPKS